MKYALIGMLLLTTSGVALAGPGNQSPDPQRMQQRIEHRLDFMDRKLDLTDTQKQQLRVIFEQEQKAMLEQRTKTHDAINKVLTPDQQKKMQSMIKKHREHRDSDRGKRWGRDDD